MGKTKSEKFTVSQNRLAATAKALAHPARIAILHVLAKRNECICGEIVDELPLSQSTISQHLKELKAVGLVKGTVEGVSTCYCIDKEKMEELKQELSFFLNEPANPDSCC